MATSSEATLPQSRTALLLVDLINPMQFSGAQDLTAPALEAAAVAARLKRRLHAQGVPAIYVNDNFGHWQSDFRSLVAMCRKLGGAAARLVRLLAPQRHDLMVLKPRHSAFYMTPLDLLLAQFGVRRLVITGLATDLCVQFSAADAFVRGYHVWVPEDCTAAESPERKAAALKWMSLALKCSVEPADQGLRGAAANGGSASSRSRAAPRRRASPRPNAAPPGQAAST